MTFSKIKSIGSALVAKAGGSLILAMGLLFFSGSTAHAQLDPPHLYTVSPTGVDLATGSFTTSVTDLSIGGLSLERSYVSADGPGGWQSSNYFGYGWTHNYDIYTRQDYVHGQNSSVVMVGRTIYRFSGWPTPTTYPQGDSIGTTLATVNGAIVFTDSDGTAYRFLPGNNVKVSTITRPDGTVLTFSYVSGLPKTIVSNRGFALVFDYSSTQVTAACGYNLAVTYVTTSTTCASAALKVTYGYTAAKLTGVTDVFGNVANYTYDSGGYLACLTDPGTTTCKVTNTHAPSRGGNAIVVTAQTTADGANWGFACDCGIAELADPEDLNPEDGTSMTEPNGATANFSFTAGSFSYYQNENGKVYTPQYGGRILYSLTSPEGNKVNFTYNDGAETKRTFVGKSGSGLGNIDQATKTYPTSCTNLIICHLPLTVTDARGALTGYTYDSIHGGVLTETKPADSAGISAVVRHNYAQKYAYIKNSGGGYSPAATPVWVLIEDRTCRNTATVNGACAGGNSDEVVTAYDYGAASGPNNLLLRGVATTADGVTRRTCFSYDWMGNKISETKPRAGLAVCS